MLTVHHLGKSQSERIVWLCEELTIAYELKHYVRDPVTNLAPPEMKALHPLGAAPIITDDGLVLAESGAIIDYILAKSGDGQLTLPVTDPGFADYLYWYHFANSNLQPVMGRNMILGRLNLPADNPIAVASLARLHLALRLLEAHVAQVEFLGGAVFTVADIMILFSLTTMRYFFPLDLSPYPAILAYIKRVSDRPAYQRAMQKGDPGMPLLLT